MNSSRRCLASSLAGVSHAPRPVLDRARSRPPARSSRHLATAVFGLLVVVSSVAVSSVAAGETAASAAQPAAVDQRFAELIWSVREARTVSRQEVLSRLAGTALVLIGETHDNPNHHRVQLQLIDALAARNREPLVAMEQFDRERQADLDRAREHSPGGSVPDARGVAAAAGFDFAGWSWPLYSPIIERALDRGWPVVGINLSRTQAVQIVRKGVEALAPEEVSRLALRTPLPPDVLLALRNDIEVGHCGLLPAQMVGAMVDAQRARDAVMAERLLLAVTGQGDRGSGSGHAPVTIAVLGRAHARLDRGVGMHMAARAPSLAMISIGLVEFDPSVAPGEGQAAGERQARAFAQADGQNDTSAGGSGRFAFDYLWFTPGIDREDPCVALTHDRTQSNRSR